MSANKLLVLTILLCLATVLVYSEETEPWHGYYEVGMGYGPSLGIPVGMKSELGLMTANGPFGGVEGSLSGNLDAKSGGIGLGVNAGTRFLDFFRVKGELGFCFLGTMTDVPPGKRRNQLRLHRSQVGA